MTSVFLKYGLLTKYWFVFPLGSHQSDPIPIFKPGLAVLKIHVIQDIWAPWHISWVYPPLGLQSSPGPSICWWVCGNMTGLSISPTQSLPRADNTQLHAQIPASSSHCQSGWEQRLRLQKHGLLHPRLLRDCLYRCDVLPEPQGMLCTKTL